jgi:hypothetical protein
MKRPSKFSAPHLPSFVRDNEAGARNWWAVAATGDDDRDSEIGDNFAIEYLFNDELRSGNGSLGWIVEAMPRKLTVVEIAFLSLIEVAAMAGRDRAREVADNWRQCRAKRSGGHQ